ncbi:MAG TPA: FdtA/QdtA family cupin domain-containing protein [Thermoanaerobaculia bacterium]|nr:FdtA/QdtA family cupin domain-containing protein [Thermoanaerobaculia bacterium]
MSSRLDRCRVIELPRIPDPRGSLTFIEGGRHIPFHVQRTYWIYDVPGGEVRGGHAYRTLEEFVVALSGSFEVEIDDGDARRTVMLNRSYRGLYVPALIWRQLKNFSTNSVCLIAASAVYDESDYLREYPDFLAAVPTES